jgi:REP element-mobilizing transposase RayT
VAYPLRGWFLQRVGSASSLMPINLKRVNGRGDLGTVHARNLAARILDEVRTKYGFALVGYVLMPEHVHLLISETQATLPAKIVQVFNQRVSLRMASGPDGTVWNLLTRNAGRGYHLNSFRRSTETRRVPHSRFVRVGLGF